MKNKKTKTIVISLVALLTLGLTVSAVGFATKGFKSWNKTIDIDPTNQKANELNADQLSQASTYILPSTLNFGYNQAESNIALKSSSINLSETNKAMVKSQFSEALSPIKIVNVVAFLTPTNADYSNVDWTVSWANENSSWATNKIVTDYVTVAKDEGLKAAISCLQAFSEPIVIKVKVSKNEIAVANTCLCQFYKSLTGLSASWSGDMSDALLGAGEKFTYSCSNVYGDGTKLLDDYGAQSLTYGTNGSLNSVVRAINYDFNNKNALVGFDYDVFYGNANNFVLADSTLSVLNGKGRNAVNTALKAMSQNNITMTIHQGSVSTSLSFGVIAESIIYPESVTIGDGSDVTINQ